MAYDLRVELYMTVSDRHDPRDVAADIKLAVEKETVNTLTDVRYAVMSGQPVAESGIPAPRKGQVEG